MNDRINSWLDGELPWEALSASEQVEARALDATIRAAAARVAEAPTPDLTGRVMARLPAASRGTSHRSAASASPARSLIARLRVGVRAAVPARGLGIRPAAAMAMLSLLVGFVLGSLFPLIGPAAGGSQAAAAAPAPQLFVRFELDAAGATDVRLAGTFTGWEPQVEMNQLGDGRWIATVPLEPGVHDYVFIVDGSEHVIDPTAPRISDGFGGYSSRLALLTPAS
jgi:hypothetical protein